MEAVNQISVIEAAMAIVFRGGWVLAPIFVLGWFGWFLMLERYAYYFMLRGGTIHAVDGGFWKNLEKKGEENRYLFGFEESYGYLSGTYVRDKDAVVASMLICEMTAYYKKQGKSLAEVIDGLYEEFGYYLNQTFAFEFEGAEGMQKMADLMSSTRENLPASVGKYKVVKVSDYQLKKETDLVTGEVEQLTLPTSNVIALHLEGDNGVIIRPSGTEPKIKLYITAVGTDKVNAIAVCDEIVAASKQLLGL